MKFFRYLFLGLIFFYLQVLVASNLVIFGVSPFFVIAFVTFAGINLPLASSATITFLIGLALDLLNPYMLGTNTIVLLLLTIIIHRGHVMIKKDKPAPFFISIAAINLLYLVPVILIKFVVFGFDAIWLTLFFPELIYNTAVSVILISLLVILQKMRIVIDL